MSESETQQQVRKFLEALQKKVGPVISVTCPKSGVLRYGIVYLIESGKKAELIELFEALTAYKDHKEESLRLLNLLKD